MSELYHHGIKGQRWGVRRFQNKDGSYTAAGKKRYQATNGDVTKKLKDYFSEDVPPKGKESDPGNQVFNRITKQYNSNEKYSKLLNEGNRKKDDIWRDPKYKTELEKQYDEFGRKRRDLSFALDDRKTPWQSRPKMEAQWYKLGADMKKLNKQMTAKSEFEKKMRLANERQKEIDKVIKRYENRAASMLLRDLGYEDTQKARRMILSIVDD